MQFPLQAGHLNLITFLILQMLVAALYEGVSKSFRTGRLARELRMLQLSASRYSRLAILWVSLASFSVIILCVPSQRVFVVVYFIIDSVRELLDTHSYMARIVFDSWNSGILGSNPARGTDVCPRFPVLCCPV
jgi:hypothetical protein